MCVCEHWVLQALPHPVHVQGNQESAWASTLRLQVNSSVHMNPQTQKLWVIDPALNDCLAMLWGLWGKEIYKSMIFSNRAISPALTLTNFGICDVAGREYRLSEYHLGQKLAFFFLQSSDRKWWRLASHVQPKTISYKEWMWLNS